MAELWLTPVTETGPDGTLTLGGDRIRVDADAAWAAFRAKLQRLHPRLVPLFKANMLLGEEADETDGSCGASAADLRLDSGEPIVLGAGGLPASHCALSFFDRLLAPSQSLQLLERLAPEPEGSGPESRLHAAIAEWLGQGCAVVVLQD